MKRHITFFILFPVLCLMTALPGCMRHEQPPSGKLQVVTTLFPLYDFARTIAGDKGEVRLLLPPGIEPHSFEPKPDDIVRIGKAGLFIYTNRYMEPWAETIIKGVDRRTLPMVNASDGVTYRKAETDDEHGHGGNGAHVAEGQAGVMDPHVWLDFGNAQRIVDNILAGFITADPAHADFYRNNAAGLRAKLAELDKRFRQELASCPTRVFLHGGHYTFGYLAGRYGLEYHALTGVSSESEPSVVRMGAMVRRIRQTGTRYLFAEELLSPRLTETLAEEAGVGILKLNGAHNLSRDDFQRGITFIGLMEENLVNLRKGLSCGTK